MAGRSAIHRDALSVWAGCSGTRLRVLAASALLWALALPGQAAAGTTYLDCSAARPGDGSLQAPLDALDAVDGLRLHAGDRLLLRRGSECAGRLHPRGAGSAGRPVVIGAYGSGPRPAIEGDRPSAVLLRNFSHVVLRDLEVTDPGDGSARRRGVHLVARRGPVSDVTVRDLRIHDVGGNLDKDARGSGGIQADVLPRDGADTPVRFDGLRIIDNRITDVSRSGIFIVGTADSTRPRASRPWPEASTGVVVRGNRIDDIAGDGIVPLGTDGALVSDNVVSDGNRAGRAVTDPAGMICSAGIWTFHANNTVIQRNEVFDMNFNGCDGTGYDIDYDQDGTVVRWNLSHDNGGGFMLLCTDTGKRAAEIAFNLSVDDRYTLQESPCQGVPIGFTGTLDGLRMYNNTFVSPHHSVGSPIDEELPAIGQAGDFLFADNILVATTTQATPFPCGEHCSHNLFSGMPPSGTDFVLADPMFADPGRRGRGRLELGTGFRLMPGSPAIGAGVEIPGGVDRDYFGNPVPAGASPAIGFDQPGPPGPVSG